MAKRKMGDVVVMLPGIMGSKLQRNGKDVWALSMPAIWKALTSGTTSLQDLALAADDPTVDDLGDGVTAPAVFEDVHLIPGLWKIDGYTKLRNFLHERFELTQGANYHEFPYDWRRDNRVHARRLASWGRDWLRKWRDQSGNAKAKLVLVAHSMGGLVSRYFLEVLGGWEDTRALITFGTPFRGSLNALETLSSGFEKKIGPWRVLDLTAMVRSLTSVHQLLPIYPVLEHAPGSYARLAEYAPGVPGLNADKVKDAFRFHQEIRDAVEANRKVEKYFTHGYGVFPIVGIRQPTSQAARLQGVKVEVLRDYFGDDRGGDGTVPRVSATPIELSNDHREVFVAESHGSLQNWDPTLVQLEGVLGGFDLSLDAFRSLLEDMAVFRPYLGPTAPIELGLDVDDAFGPGEPIAIAARSERAPEGLSAGLTTAEGASVGTVSLKKDAEGWHRGTHAPLASGVYRVRVFGDASVQPVTDVFEVYAD